MAAKLRERDGFYWVVVHVNGRRKWKKIGRDKREALKVVHKINAQLALGSYQIEAPQRERTVAEALRAWFAAYRPTFSESFTESAEIIMRVHLEPAFGSIPLSKLCERDLLGFVRAQTEEKTRPLSPATLTNILSLLRRVLTLAVDEGELQRNPCRNLGRLLTKVRQQRASEVSRVDSWTREEVARLLGLAQAHEPRFHPLLLFLLSTGCRKGEGIAIKWEDVDLVGGRVLIRRAFVRGRFRTPKTGRARSVALSPALAAALEDLLAQRRREALERGWPEVPELVFCSETSGPLDDRNVTRSWDRLRRRAKAAGVRPLRLHDARHSFASLALASGKSIRWVAAQLGHANPELTLRVYAHALREEEADLSFLDFAGGTRRHPRGTERMRAIGTTKPLRVTPRRGLRMLERETGIEPATLGLGSRCSTS